MRRILTVIFSLMTFEAFAQTPVTLFTNSPAPWYKGGNIFVQYHKMRELFPPGSCLKGTFMSADMSVLTIKNVRVSPDAQFWPHNAYRTGPGIQNPWHIDKAATVAFFSDFPPKLRNDILSRIGETTNFVVYYTGNDLIHKFGYKGC